jgi:hypothetical protein
MLTRGHLRRLACLGTGLAAIVVLAAVGDAAAPRSSYFRVAVSPECTVYGLIQDRELRFSATPEGLETVSAIEAENLNISNMEGGGVWYSYTFPEATLSVPEEQLPSGFAKVRITLRYNVTKMQSRRGGRGDSAYIYGSAGLCREDERGVEWGYWSRVGTEAGSSPGRAPVMKVPTAGKLSLKITTQAKGRREIGIAVQVMAGETALDDVKKAGKSVTAELEVLDKDRKTVASERKTLSELGFT